MIMNYIKAKTAQAPKIAMSFMCVGGGERGGIFVNYIISKCSKLAQVHENRHEWIGKVFTGNYASELVKIRIIDVP